MTLQRSHTRYEKAGGTAVLSLARPENRNAITGPDMLSEIIGANDDAETVPEVGVPVISGEVPSSILGSFQETAKPGYCRAPSARNGRPNWPSPVARSTPPKH